MKRRGRHGQRGCCEGQGKSETIDKALKPKGVAVMIEAVHQCMSIRGVKKLDVATITTQFTGIFKEEPAQQARFMMLATERSRI